MSTEKMTDARALREAIDLYWELAYAEGKDGRTHDTENGDAQKTSMEIDRLIARLRGEAAQGEQQAVAWPDLPKPFHVEYDDIDHTDVPCYSDVQMRAYAQAALSAAPAAPAPVAGDAVGWVFYYTDDSHTPFVKLCADEAELLAAVENDWMGDPGALSDWGERMGPHIVEDLIMCGQFNAEDGSCYAIRAALAQDRASQVGAAGGGNSLTWLGTVQSSPAAEGEVRNGG